MPEDRQITLPVTLENETVWLNRNQMAQLFDRDKKRLVSILTMRYRKNLTIELSQILRQFKLRAEELSSV